nr:hypothetical protein [Candidatus Sigynarchaeota archaeon]
MENDQEYRFSNWITKQPLENETPANITPLEDKESEYEKWFNEYEKFKSVFEVLDNKLIKFVEFMSGKNNGRFEFSYYVGLGRSGSGIATMLGLRANPPIPVGYLSDSQYPFPMKSYMMPNLALLHGIKDKADICIIDSVVKSGIHVIIAIDHIIKAHEIAGKSINSITVACVQFRYKHLIPDLVQEYIEKQYKNYNVYFVYGF